MTEYACTHKLVVSIYSNTETSLAMSGLAISASQHLQHVWKSVVHD